MNILVGEFGHPVWLPNWKSLQRDLFSWPAAISFVRPHSKDWSPLDWRSPSFVAFSDSLPPSFTLATSHFDQSRGRMRMRRVKFWTGLVSVNSDEVIVVYSAASWWCHGTTMIIRIAWQSWHIITIMLWHQLSPITGTALGRCLRRVACGYIDVILLHSHRQSSSLSRHVCPLNTLIPLVNFLRFGPRRFSSWRSGGGSPESLDREDSRHT